MRRFKPFRRPRSEMLRLAALISLAAAAAVLGLAGDAGADWLVTHDGRQVEIQGTWEERGELLIFHLTDGTFASMRKSQVNLEESQRLTRAAQVPMEQAADTAPPAREKAVFVLTDADVRHVRDQALTEESAPTGVASGPVPARDPVEVTGWRSADLPSGDGLVVTGTARNQSEDTVAGLSLDVVALDRDGDVQTTAPATLGATVLAPGQSCTLSADLIGVFDITAVDFDFNYIPVRTDSAPVASQSTQRPEQE